MLCLICRKQEKETCFYNFFANKLICCNCYKGINLNYQIATYNSHTITTLFKYDSTIKELIRLWKVNKEPNSIKVIAQLIQKFLPKNKTVVFPPSFTTLNTPNHIEDLLLEMNLKYQNIFVKTEKYKQRILAPENKKSNIALVIQPKKKPILFDDIYTSGKTIKKTIDLLEKAGYKNLNVFIIATNKIIK